MIRVQKAGRGVVLREKDALEVGKMPLNLGAERRCSDPMRVQLNNVGLEGVRMKERPEKEEGGEQELSFGSHGGMSKRTREVGAGCMVWRRLEGGYLKELQRIQKRVRREGSWRTEREEETRENEELDVTRILCLGKEPKSLASRLPSRDVMLDFNKQFPWTLS